MSGYNNHPALLDIRAELFNYPADIMPYQFMDYYYHLPVPTPSSGTLVVSATRYVSGVVEPGITERKAWRAAVDAYFNKNGWDADIKSWIKLDRNAAVFNGHGLPEEIALVCRLALLSGYKTVATLPDWVSKSIGIDCNGFVNAYYTAAGYFGQPLHSHPSYINVSPPARTVSEINWDSAIVTARTISGVALPTDPPPSQDEDNYRVKINPGGKFDKGAHILVIDNWAEYGKTFWASDQPGTNYPGPRCLIYEIVKPPAAGAKRKKNYVWTIRKQGSGTDGDRLVYITRQMQSH